MAMTRIARYAKAVAHPGDGAQLADGLLAAAAALEAVTGCELYLVSR
jgi:hypothetical protein